MEFEKTLKIVLNLLIFTAGFISCLIVFYLFSSYSSGLDNPLGNSFTSFNSNAKAPGDWINLEQIEVNDDSIVIKIPNASLSSYAPTGSMKPVFDAGANGIRIIPASSNQINIGDIVTYGDENIVHRVVEKGQDENGAWFLTKGDNNNVDDGDKIRFSDIKYVTIGVLY
jgi:hypothetical protein